MYIYKYMCIYIYIHIYIYILTFFLAFYLTVSCLAEVQQCSLRSGTRSWDPTLPEEKKKEEKATLIKSRDPHLAGGEKSINGAYRIAMFDYQMAIHGD